MVATSLKKHVVASGSAERNSARWVSQVLALLSRSGGRLKLTYEPESGPPQEGYVDRRFALAIQELGELVQAADEISMFANDPEVSPEQASEVLGMSRPMVVQRIKCGDLQARMVGAHHRIKMSDLVAFRDQEAEREAALAEFSDLTDEMAAKHGF